ncbi:mechanosensitive cation channel TMEM63B-like isoform X2 [Tubulanus polymorphus]|uniref:mechanosensitive cation channel TMEM63B-like isoform X2 n=1 Tax=Tubulanus polymorphus TaxID=672921 RepID=UPI003DA5890D
MSVFNSSLHTITKGGLNVKCDRYYSQNRTVILYGGYEGIPQTLILNVIGWTVLLFGFSILRKIAWDYGRIALVSRNEERSLLYGTSKYNVWTQLFFGDHEGGNPQTVNVGSQESLDTNIRLQDKGLCSWIVAFFRIKDEHIQRKSGKDAVQYLSFQRYLILYTAIVCVFSIAVVLPVNFMGDLEGNDQTFGHTTISNVESGSPYLWVHAVLAVLFLIIAVYMMRHFSVNLNYEEDEQATRTLMVSHIPKDQCFKNVILQHFQEAYPEAVIQDVQFAYNITRLVKLDKDRNFATEGRQNSEMIYNKTGIRPMIRPYYFGQLCCCCEPCTEDTAVNEDGETVTKPNMCSKLCCCCRACARQVDAINYYGDEEAQLKAKCEDEKVNAFQDALGIAFITFEEDHMAAQIYNDFRASCKASSNPHSSSIGRELDVTDWSVKYAPAPDNIYWENLAVDPIVWWIKAILINLIVFLLLFFLSTPTIIMNSLDEIHIRKGLEETHSAILVQFVPTLILWTFAALLPQIVYYSDQFIGHWTRTAEHHAVMRKTFLFLLVMVVILPSLGLTSAKAFFEWAVKDKDRKFRWQCVFLPGNGAFFVNYVITSAFIGTGLELIRFPELFMYAIRLLAARSAAEKTAVRKAIIWQFQFGCEYAWMLCIFAVIIVYSIPCPLIVPFGLVYLCLKHVVDRYNIYFAYGPSRIDKDIHASAINFVIVAIILLQFNVVFFSVLRSEQMHGLSVFSMIALFVTLIIFFGRVFFGWFKGLSPITYKQFSEREAAHDGQKPFVPNVLMNDKSKQNGTVTNPATSTYGTNVDTPQSSPEHEVQQQ